MTKPITPDQVLGKKAEMLPDFVFEIWNNLIAKNWKNDCAVIGQDEIKAVLYSEVPEGQSIFKTGWLDIEEIYREAGWKVEYDKPAYNEATFKFTKP